MNSVYYNEFDLKKAAWLEQLIKNGLIADGCVDTRDIRDVNPQDLSEFTQHHFFAGIGVWSYALRQSGWSDSKPVWTASLPCQPFSTAGKQNGKKDDRHLLPHFIELIQQCRPDTIFGEQVENAIKHGWLDDLQAVMERESYAVGACILGSHSIGAAHIRKRLYWVAHAPSERCRETGAGIHRPTERESGCSWIPDTKEQRHQKLSVFRIISSKTTCNAPWKDLAGNRRMGSTTGHNKQRNRQSQKSNESQKSARGSGLSDSELEWIYCRDEKYRPIKPGLEPLVNGPTRGLVPGRRSCLPFDPNYTQEARVMRLKGYGDAIDWRVAKEFIQAFINVISNN